MLTTFVKRILEISERAGSEAKLEGFLLGKQIGTTIFEYMNVPVFQAENPVHRHLARVSIAAHEQRKGTKAKKPLDDRLEEEIDKQLRSLF